MRRSRGAGKAAAEEALALLVSGAVKSQTAAAAAVGISEGRLSSVKTQLKPAYYKFNLQPTEVVELSWGVTFIKEVSCGDETNMSMEEKRARQKRNYKHKMEALLQVAAVAAAAAAPTVEVGGTGLEFASLGAQQVAEQSGVELGEAELSGAEGELDEAGGEAGGELTETAESELWRQIEALNGLRTAGCSAAACKATAQVASPGALTRQILGLDHSHAERRTRSYTPHERAALSAAQRRNVSENHTACLCACCGDTRVFGVELGRAQSFQEGSCAMYGANRFINHEVSLSVLMAEAYMDEHGWSPVVTIPRCHRCVFEEALVGSAARSEAEALFAWHRELDLNLAAERASASALRLPYVEPAPDLLVDTGTGFESHLGMASVYVLLNKDDMQYDRSLRQLWYKTLTPELLAGYKPLHVDEQLLIDTAAAAVAMGSEPRAVGLTGARQAVRRAGVMLVIVEAEPESHAVAAAAVAALREQRGSVAAHVGVLRAILQEAAASHVLLPNGAKMSEKTEALANRAEAQALNVLPEALTRQRFDRTGAASGMMDAKHVAERLGLSPLVQAEATRKWGPEIQFLAQTDTTGGMKAAAMSYVAGEQARARVKRCAGDTGSKKQCLRDDGPDQPRHIRVNNSVRGVHLKDKELLELQCNEDYMQLVRIPQMRNACLCLLTLRTLGFGGAPLGACDLCMAVAHVIYVMRMLCLRRTGNSSSSTIAKASTTMVRVIQEHGSLAKGVEYMASNTITSVNLGALPVHVDGVKGGREPMAELCTTRWAEALRQLSTADRVAELVAARRVQAELSMCLWLRHHIALDVTPANALAIVAGTEEDHGVPEPLPDADGRDLERGFTRSHAQSLRPDDATSGDASSFDDNHERRLGMRPRHAAGGQQQAAGTGRTRRDASRPQRTEAARAAPARLGTSARPPALQGAPVNRAKRGRSPQNKARKY